MEKFVWSCTKFLAALLCAFCLSTLLGLAGLVLHKDELE